MYMYVRVSMYVCLCVCVYVCTYVHMYIFVGVIMVLKRWLWKHREVKTRRSRQSAFPELSWVIIAPRLVSRFSVTQTGAERRSFQDE